MKPSQTGTYERHRGHFKFLAIGTGFVLCDHYRALVWSDKAEACERLSRACQLLRSQGQDSFLD